MRTVFQKLIGVPPGQYRQHFQGTRLKPRVTVQQGVAPAHR
jgi:hypothetical protein